LIELKNITKYYGDFPAVTNISFKIEKGEIVGLLGPNGAGKSTTMKMITGFMPPTSGELSVGGNDIVSQSIEARRRIGYLPETVPLYTDMTVYSYIEYMGLLRGLNKKNIKSKIDNVIEICKLEDYRNSLISKLSKGFRQRVGISQAIIHEPEVLVLDEPTIGIDPNQVVETRQLIKNLSGEHTLILSSHILPEVSSICERVLIIHEGEIAASDTIENLSSLMSGKNKVEADIIGSPQAIVAELEKINGVKSVQFSINKSSNEFSTFSIESEINSDIRSEISKIIINNDWGLIRLQSMGMSLEDIFLQITTSE
jgi:ABC-2 type transport system ATP-binding protein|tara:strand:- start:15704 stop:16642 length:939 start_codon:yes stop_codon:yes gene_type:complete